MRVTLLINRFPPDSAGGYELRFGDLRAALTALGHEVGVLTTRPRFPVPGVEPGIERCLGRYPETIGISGILRLAKGSLVDCACLRRHLRRDGPDVVLVGNFAGLTACLWSVFAGSAVPLVLDVSNGWLGEIWSTHGNWFRIWERPPGSRSKAWLRRIGATLSRLVDPVSLRTSFPGITAAAVVATAEHLRQSLIDRVGSAAESVQVLPSGIQIADFPWRGLSRDPGKLLYMGRLKPTKGVDTAIRAMELLPSSFTLTVVGVPDDPGYERDLRALPAARAGRVVFRPPVERREVPMVFAEHGMLIFPSVWEEPFSRLILEAQACGVPVVATATGGSADVVSDGRTGFVFPAADPHGLATQIRRVAADRELRLRVTECARAEVERRFTMDEYAKAVERILRAATAGAQGRVQIGRASARTT